MASIAETSEGHIHRGVLGRLQDRLAASDPAYSRLRLASRGLLSLLIAGALLAGFSALAHPLPIAAFGLAVVIAFTGSMAVRDKSFGQQAVTRAYAWAGAMLAVFAASLLAPIPLVAHAAFLVVIFGAVYVRRFGPRWFAVGMITFMAYFIGDYLRPAPGDIGWLALAGAIAFGATQAVTGWVLRDDAERDFRRALVTIDQRIQGILRALIVDGAVDRPAMQEQLSRLRDVVMMAEGFIPQGEAGSLAARGAASDLAVALFDLQLAVERLARASYLGPPPAELVRASLAGHLPPESDAEATAARLLLRVGRARAKLGATLRQRPSPAFVSQ